MPALDSILQQKLAALAAADASRTLHETKRCGVQLERAGKPLISFACNDYLGLSAHPQVVQAAQAALAAQGAGAGASRLISGNHAAYGPLEQALVTHYGAQAACVFGSGYLANMGAIAALVGEGDLIVADKLVHACMVDGARLSGAKFLRFAHNDLAHAEALLKANRAQHRHCLLLSESIFSMDGDAAPLPELAALAQTHDAWLMIDHAHDLYLPQAAWPHENIIHMGTLSKSLGTYGGYVCGSQLLVGFLKTSARSFMFSTALPPAVVASAQVALALATQEPQRAQQALSMANLFCKKLGLAQTASAIVPLLVGENARALWLSQALELRGFYVPAIRPPTVPPGTARLRFSFSALHTPQQVEALVAALKELL
jgi:8-amino-7-oxononanoate synthase